MGMHLNAISFFFLLSGKLLEWMTETARCQSQGWVTLTTVKGKKDVRKEPKISIVSLNMKLYYSCVS